MQYKRITKKSVDYKLHRWHDVGSWFSYLKELKVHYASLSSPWPIFSQFVLKCHQMTTWAVRIVSRMDHHFPTKMTNKRVAPHFGGCFAPTSQNKSRHPWEFFNPNQIPKIKMESQNWWFVDVSSFSRGVFFRFPPFVFGGVLMLASLTDAWRNWVCTEKAKASFARNCLLTSNHLARLQMALQFFLHFFGCFRNATLLFLVLWITRSSPRPRSLVGT